MMKPTILMILVLFSGVAAADDIYLTLGGWSAHSHSSYPKCTGSRNLSGYYMKSNCESIKYNSNHQGIIIDYKGFTVGTYKNSYFSRTNLIGYTHRIKRFSFVAAYGTGYIIEGARNDCTLRVGKECALLSLGYTYRSVKASLMGKALAVSFEFKL
jgi:hypothetical protein